MALQFPANPQEGDFFEVSPGRRYRRVNGRWSMWINNQPVTEASPVVPPPPTYSATAPDYTVTRNPYWYDAVNKCLKVVVNDGTQNLWVPASTLPSTMTPIPPVVAADAPDISKGITNPYWYDLTNGCLMVAVNDGSKNIWVRA